MPQEHECCGNGCDDCVWTHYFDEQKEYLERKRKWDRMQKDKKELEGKLEGAQSCVELGGN